MKTNNYLIFVENILFGLFLTAHGGWVSSYVTAQPASTIADADLPQLNPSTIENYESPRYFTDLPDVPQSQILALLDGQSMANVAQSSVAHHRQVKERKMNMNQVMERKCGTHIMPYAWKYSRGEDIQHEWLDFLEDARLLDGCLSFLRVHRSNIPYTSKGYINILLSVKTAAEMPALRARYGNFVRWGLKLTGNTVIQEELGMLEAAAKIETKDGFLWDKLEIDTETENTDGQGIINQNAHHSQLLKSIQAVFESQNCAMRIFQGKSTDGVPFFIRSGEHEFPSKFFRTLSKNCPDLQVLRITGTYEKSYEPFSKLLSAYSWSNLKYLEIPLGFSETASNSLLHLFQKLPHLEELVVKNQASYNFDFKNFANALKYCPRLKKLGLSGNNLGYYHKSLRESWFLRDVLKNTPNLEELNVSNEIWSENEVKTLAGIVNKYNLKLQKLDLSQNFIKDKVDSSKFESWFNGPRFVLFGPLRTVPIQLILDD